MRVRAEVFFQIPDDDTLSPGEWADNIHDVVAESDMARSWRVSNISCVVQIEES